MEKQQEVLVPKTYHLIKSGPRVELLRTIQGKKVPVEVWDDFPMPLKFRTTDAEGNSITYRFISESNEVEMAAQIKLGFLANYKFTQRDRDSLRFKNGYLTSTRKNIKAFLDTIPANEAFTGERDETEVLFREYKPEVVRKANLNLGFRQAQALVAAHSLSEEQMDIKLIKIYGSAYQLPVGADAEKQKEAKLEALQDAINAVDDNSESVLTIITKTEDQDNVETIIGKAVNAGVISFLEKADQIMIKRNGLFVEFLKISDQQNEEQKMNLFIDRLSASDGGPMLTAVKEALLVANIAISEADKELFVSSPSEKQEEPKSLSDEELLEQFETRFGGKMDKMMEKRANDIAAKNLTLPDKKADKNKVDANKTD